MDDERNAGRRKKTRYHGMLCLGIGITPGRRFKRTAEGDVMKLKLTLIAASLDLSCAGQAHAQQA
jgi:hypothetical protein